jgi:hypothetical protein
MRDLLSPFVDFPLREDALEALYRHPRENLVTLMPGYWRRPTAQLLLVDTLIATLPPLAYLLYYGFSLVQRLGLAWPMALVLSAALGAAGVVPLLLNLVGWDAARWSAIATMNAFVCVLTVRLYFDAGAPDARAHRIPSLLIPALAATAVVLGLCTSYSRFLFDGYTVRWFPFRDRVQEAVELVRSGFSFRPL